MLQRLSHFIYESTFLKNHDVEYYRKKVSTGACQYRYGPVTSLNRSVWTHMSELTNWKHKKFYRK